MPVTELENVDTDLFKNEENADKFPLSESLEEKNDDKDLKLDTTIDISGKILDFPLINSEERSVEEVYMYKNELNVIPRDVGRFKGLKTLKFFSNQLNLFPQEFDNLGGLEHLQLKVAELGVNGLELSKLRNLKDLELSRVPPRPSTFTILSAIAGLKCLTRLSVCHFSIRYLPPEIGCLDKLEHLDLSFNKIRCLPDEIALLKLLRSLKVANNKLIDLPSQLSHLQRLEHLDLSKNRLTSLDCLDLESMHNLRILNLQHNQLSKSLIPSWICCTLEGNVPDVLNDEYLEMDINEDVIEEIHGSSVAQSSNISGLLPNSRQCLATRRPEGWKRRYNMRTKAQGERSNNSKKWKVEAIAQISSEKCLACTVSAPSDNDPSEDLSVKGNGHENSLTSPADENFPVTEESESGCSCFVADSDGLSKDVVAANSGPKVLSDAHSDDGVVLNGSSSSKSSTCISKSKRHSEKDLDNPKPTKSQRPTNDPSYLSRQYSERSFCGIVDYLPDGFYDAGRDRPFMGLGSYEQNLHVNLREVVLLDRGRDEELDAILLRARAFLSRFKQMTNAINGRTVGAIDSLQLASLLALFVSDHFGGSDKSTVLQRTRRAVIGSNHAKPFVCTCATGTIGHRDKVCKVGVSIVDDVVFHDICEKALKSTKERLNSIIVPIGGMQYGVCRHRALLMKYLCDRMEPRIPCELVRGHLDFSPHAWNVIVAERGDSLCRMIVDACHPHDIRKESDPEYFCRYIPLSRMSDIFVTDPDASPNCSFPSLSLCHEIGKVGSTSMMRCNVGELEAAVKVRTIEVSGTCADEMRNFDLSCLGEVRMLSSIKHSCIVEFYGHQMKSEWSITPDGNPGSRRTLQSAILMEYIKGSSLKDYLEKLSSAGENHVSPNLALNIARDVAFALTELHSRDIIHRDVKSENILVDLERKRPDGSPVVKICDLDRAVPACSYMHKCCIAHVGVPPPDVCVGTPRWMAPEVFRAMHQRNLYSLEVDIWSFGCVLLELLTLRVPYADLPEAEIHNFLQRGERPKLTDELEALAQSDSNLETDPGTLKFLSKLYHQCTEKNPADRPSANKIYDLLAERARSVAGSTTSDRD